MGIVKIEVFQCSNENVRDDEPLFSLSFTNDSNDRYWQNVNNVHKIAARKSVEYNTPFEVYVDGVRTLAITPHAGKAML